MNKALIIGVVIILLVVIGVWVSKSAERQKEAAAKALADGQQFLKENTQRDGIITTASGLQYEILQEGEGDKPTLSSSVTTHYHGTLSDGTVFDSSVERGQPATFGVSQVIKGWQEGIPLMSAGAKYRFYVPQELAYGMRSPSPSIPPGSMLIFEVELLSFK
ncbi:MAG: FKBP-type peptidyl-prolyl cis-trans isomerase FklB (EC [uncultured Aureispira sp.]|uniref:Peptidyl-prolyl cis-trans isomerase n=1 Tax=uncultured Aureispira sp. TaxID=1331704 RepID=A0A6S6TDG2_9BACT|nr:MAG: FKBP-type peptidyl-prolyl cis-trans isomerase FklB (EC [uncultured Aureispira sp.]